MCNENFAPEKQSSRKVRDEFSSNREQVSEVEMNKCKHTEKQASK